MTRRGTAHEMLRFAGTELPDDHRRALEMWIQGLDYPTVAATLELAGAGEAERLVRAALQRLRRHFRDKDPEPV